MDKSNEEIMELAHTPVPGYRTAFYIIFGQSLIFYNWVRRRKPHLKPFYESINHG